jgi:hypothetical protein
VRLVGKRLDVLSPEGVKTYGLDGVTAVGAWLRPRPDGDEVVLALTWPHQRLVLSVRAPGASWPGAVALDRWEARLGPLGALRRGVGGRRDEVPQTFTDPALLADLRGRLPRTQARVFRLFRDGPPALDPLGAAAGEPDDALWLDERGWWVGEGPKHELNPRFLGPVSRVVQVTQVGPTPLVHLWLDLGGLTLTVPWLGAGGGVQAAADPGGPALGGVEGASLLDFLEERGLGWPVHGFREEHPLAPPLPDTL